MQRTRIKKDTFSASIKFGEQFGSPNWSDRWWKAWKSSEVAHSSARMKGPNNRTSEQPKYRISKIPNNQNA